MISLKINRKVSAGIIVLLCAALMVAGFASAKFVYSLSIKEPILSLDKNIPLEKNNPDFKSKIEGTLNGWTDEKYYKEPIDKTIVLFSSEKIPGLAVIYYPLEKRLIAGSPPMVIDNVYLFNGYKHHLGYVFKDSQQGLFYDGQLIAASDFLPRTQNSFTGMTTGGYLSEVSTSIQLEIDSDEAAQLGLAGFFK